MYRKIYRKQRLSKFGYPSPRSKRAKKIFLEAKEAAKKAAEENADTVKKADKDADARAIKMAAFLVTEYKKKFGNKQVDKKGSIDAGDLSEQKIAKNNAIGFHVKK